MVKKTLRGLGLLSLLLILPMFLSADFLVLGPADFTARVNDPAQSGFVITKDNIKPGAGDPERYYYAALHLPEGVRVREMTLYYYDNAAGSITVRFFKHRLYDQVDVLSMQHTTTGSASFDRIDTIPGTAIAAKLIQNQSNRFLIQIYFSTGDINLKFNALKIKYY